jgi:peroxiredoxin
MSFWKSLFITPYLAGSSLLFTTAAWNLGHGRLAWGGVILSTLPVLIVTVGNVAFHFLSTTKRYLPWPSALAGIGTAWTMGAFLMDASARLALVAQGFAAAGYLAYLFWYSSFRRKPASALRNGSTLPEFHLMTPEGGTVSSRSLLGAPALIVFYRGNWCPLCVTQITEVAGRYREMEALGIRVVMVSPQPPQHSKALSNRFDAPMTFWVDPDNAAARQLGIVDEQGLPIGMEALGYDRDTVLPTSIMTDASGTVFYNDQTDSYRVRPSPDEFLQAFRAWNGAASADGLSAPRRLSPIKATF